MTNSSPSHWISAVSDITGEDVFIRGYAMRELVGTLNFPAIAFLIIRGKLPTPGQSRMMDVILCSILDYGLQKSGTIAARAVASVNPQMLPGIAAGVLAAGEYAVSPEATAQFIAETYQAWQGSGEPMQRHASRLVDDLRREKRRIPGFGHPIFRGVDPRAERLRQVAVECGIWGEVNQWYEALHAAFQAAAGKPELVMNDVGMLAGIMTQMGFTPSEMAGLAVLSTFPGLIAHVSEELQSGVRNRIIADSNVDYAHERRDLGTDMAAAGWQ